MCDATPDSTCSLPSSVQAPSLARSFVQSMLCREHALSADAVVTLLVDELVTQALLYGAPPISVTLRCGVTDVTIEVGDSSPEVAVPEAPDHELSMLLVDKIAHSWGTDRSKDGKVVWCKVPSGALPQIRSYRPWSITEDPVEAVWVPASDAPRRGESGRRAV